MMTNSFLDQIFTVKLHEKICFF